MRQRALLERLEGQARGELGRNPDKSELSQQLRAEMLEHFDGVPSSILWVNKALDVEDPDAKGRNAVGYTEDRPTDMYGAQKAKRRLSIFEGRLAQFCIRLWSDPGDLVLDPFAGRLCRLQMAVSNGRRYLGYDTSPAAVKQNRAWITRNKAKEKAEIRRASVLWHPPTPDSADMVFTCPPYWNSEWYGDNEGGIEALHSYGDFVEELAAILALSADALRENGYFVIVVKDFFLHRQQVSLHSDVIRIMTRLGLVQWDCIAKKVSTLRDMFHRDIVQHRRTGQTHEFVLVFRKSPHRRGVDLYRKHCDDNQAKRRRAEERYRKRRLDVLKTHQLEPSWIRPALRYDRTT